MLNSRRTKHSPQGQRFRRRWWEWRWWWSRFPGGFGPSCDRGDGDGSSGSSSRLLRPPKLPSPLAFASEPERGAGGGIGGGGGGGGVGGDARISRRWLLVLCGDGSDSEKLLPAKIASWE